jgi:hypothetical protein
MLGESANLFPQPTEQTLRITACCSIFSAEAAMRPTPAVMDLSRLEFLVYFPKLPTFVIQLSSARRQGIQRSRTRSPACLPQLELRSATRPSIVRRLGHASTCASPKVCSATARCRPRGRYGDLTSAVSACSRLDARLGASRGTPSQRDRRARRSGNAHVWPLLPWTSLA